jgi:hypothetical protein
MGNVYDVFTLLKSFRLHESIEFRIYDLTESGLSSKSILTEGV